MFKVSVGWPLALCVLALVVVFMMLQPLAHGAGWSHSYSYNAVWILEFNDTLRRGIFPPRWLHGAFNGLGAPSFYFYPPLPFYLSALVGAFVRPGDHAAIIAWTSFWMTLGSGAAMFAWLRGKAGDAWALVGAVLYVVAPYHQIDYFVRGAYGETAAYMMLPLFMICLERAARSRAWIPALALASAGLMLSHLLVTMLVIVSVLPVYGAFLIFTAPAAERPAVALRCLAGGVLGAALAATYLGPALLMQGASSLNWMWGTRDADPYNWVLFRPDLWPQRNYALEMAWLGWGVGAAGLAAVVAGLGRTMTRERLEIVVAGGAVLLGFLLYGVPWVWHGPIGAVLGKAQFPYRLLVGMEFAAVTGVTLALAQGRWLRLAPLLLVGALLAKQGMDMAAVPIEFNRQQIGDLYGDTGRQVAMRRVPAEQLPGGFFANSERWRADTAGMTGYDDLPLAAPENDGARVTAASTFPDGTIAVAVSATRPTRIVVRRFFFPTWEVGLVRPGRDPVVRAEPVGLDRLLSFTAAPGQETYRIRIVRSPLEKICDAISLVALLGVLVWLGLSLRRCLLARSDDQGLQGRFRAFMRIRTR